MLRQNMRYWITGYKIGVRNRNREVIFCLTAYEAVLDSVYISAVHFGNKMSEKISEGVQQQTNMI